MADQGGTPTKPEGLPCPPLDINIRTDSDLLIPPLNFGRVCRGVYRSGFPGKKNFTFLNQLRLKTVVNLSEHEYTQEAAEFVANNQISYTQMSLKGNREPFITCNEKVVQDVLMKILDATAEEPILIHCTKGTYRTGCVVGCLRKLEQWSLTSIFDEYRRYAGAKVHNLDQQFIEFFKPAAEHW
eukprot:CAMPEP_0184314552 /NCGR_PEP_ID=MMETSP1049-20130417/75317_1 /TAXON_ID=77928 /ORGANISM="Proteomonas sulcata, Strain CCMP704" /LENGTH=183 /DNA_ID=CAMNT_0026632531 /DNA_START=59 /DNA_END=607 /DNA_ORIENTATION=-